MEGKKDMIIGQGTGKNSRSKKKKRGGKKSRKKIVERNEEIKYKDDIVSFNTTHPDLEKNVIIFSMHTQKYT